MPTVDQHLSEDAWLLGLEAYTYEVAEVHATPLTSIVGVVDAVSGEAFAGLFVASSPTLGIRQFHTLVCDATGAVHEFEGTLVDDGFGHLQLGTVTDTLVNASGSLPNSMSHNGTQWSYLYDGTAVGTHAAVFGFTPVMAGIILFRLPGTSAADVPTARLTTFRTFTGTMTFPGQPSLDVAVTTDPDDGEYSIPTVVGHPGIHAIVGAPFGDLEFDIGKSVPWVRNFVNDIFITDINLGNQRYWVVDWARSFPEAKTISLGLDFFTNPVAFRQAQFAAAEAAWNYDDDDWVLFLDGSEGLSCDTRTPPPEASYDLFKPYLYREIDRAIGLGHDRVVVPFYAFVRNADQPDPRRFIDIEDPTTVQQNLAGTGQDPTAWNTAVIYVSQPYYYQRQLAAGSGCVRLVKVSALRNPGFDWATIDTLSDPDAGCFIQVISYAYAHWTNPENGEDDGFKMRQKIDLVRPMLGLPVVGSDASGTAGPFKVAVDGQIVQETGVGTSAPLYTPMYESYFRRAPQDGVWYVKGVIAADTVDPPYAFAFPTPLGVAYAFDAEVQVAS